MPTSDLKEVEQCIMQSGYHDMERSPASQQGCTPLPHGGGFNFAHIDDHLVDPRNLAAIEQPDASAFHLEPRLGAFVDVRGVAEWECRSRYFGWCSSLMSIEPRC